MNKLVKFSISALLFSFFVSAANASVVTIGSITKQYGSVGGAVASTSSFSCDTLNANSIRITDSSGCQRFHDLFNFSAMNYQNIDHLKLTLTFGATNDRYMGFFAEDWRVRAADSVSHGSSTLLDMTSVSGTTTQSFTIDATLTDVFPNIINNGKFYLWFADQGVGPNNFNLMSARLDVNGTAVPEPAGIALFGLALAGLMFARRRRV